jgi:hypothetical protein
LSRHGTALRIRWLMHQLDIDTALIYTADGFTVRLRAGKIPD